MIESFSRNARQQGVCGVAETSEGFFSPNLRCITSGAVDGGSGRQICKSPFHWEYMK
ncbi:hypothetical protein [Phocaeicola vulgatus]|uniref:hypothetical protein n=1 Tax=Phocaeicola vulgatus TaxID=821 RepID=UPI0015F3013E|nr:hypothetical protein [Phocaeicola vulgatus]